MQQQHKSRAEIAEYLIENSHARTPTVIQAQQWMMEGGCEAIDGCWVEPDGHCPHGFPSWLLHIGLI